MTLLEPNYIELITKNLGFKAFQVEAVLSMIAEGATVPFIARYRKERTGNLDEVMIRDIIDLQKKEENLYKAKLTAINGIEEQGKMTPELYENIVNAKTLKEVEDIYTPYRLKKKTKAMLAIEKGFQIVADMIKENKPLDVGNEYLHSDDEKRNENIRSLLEKYPLEEIIEGSQEIIAAEIRANAIIRDELREYLLDFGLVISKIKGDKAIEKLNDKTKEEIKKFDIYRDFSVSISRVKPYQTLAMNRGENLGILGVKIEKTEESLNIVKKSFSTGELIPELAEAVKKGFESLFGSLENELRSMMTEIGEDDSIRTFQTNLAALLMTKPDYSKKILAIDPGFRTGCKIVVLDEGGNPVEFSKIFLESQNEAMEKIKKLEAKHNFEIIVIGNGTASNESVELVQKVSSKKIVIVNESGASVYSASKLAAEEFPELDVTDRGTISIGRRYIDPLSELVKVPVSSIGVGMYQHDIAEKKLEEKLANTVEDTVNEVGVNVNVASVYVLNYISGFDKRSAKKVYEKRPYKSRKDLAKVLGAKAYEQAAGFLRVPDSKEKFDNTNIHPEQYELAKYVIENNIRALDFDKNEDALVAIYPDVNKDTVRFIWESYNAIGADPRVNSTHMEVGKKLDIKELKEGDILDGVVRNVLAFGAFVDIGLKNDGLVHISEIADTFVKDPMDFVKVGEKKKVRVVLVDLEKNKVQLSMRGM
ncbi:MAG: Tex-like N-terminal domain-containing protein [Candidatus Gracilibacteria bacterium]|nr:Tex-like N-terminal domain-containing protein [Candidatus Gracilibacteria bacterium]